MSVRDETAPESVRGVSVEDTADHAIDVSQPNDRCARGHMMALRRLLLTSGLAPTAETLGLSEGGEVPRTRMTDAYDVFMSDRLGEIDATAASPESGTDGAISLPTAGSFEHGSDLKRQRILAAIGVLAVIAAAVLAVLWVSALSSRDSAALERDVAQSAVTVETERTADALDLLEATKVDLEAALADNEQLVAELDATEADAAEAATAAARAAEAEAALDDMFVENETLVAEITALETSLSAFRDASSSAAFDINTAPDLARYIGEQLSSSSRPTALDNAQTTCLGTAVVNDLGLETLGSGLASGASTDERTEVVEAIERAAAGCNIDPSSIF